MHYYFRCNTCDPEQIRGSYVYWCIFALFFKLSIQYDYVIFFVFWNKKDFKAIILFSANVYSICWKYFYSYQICKVFVSLIAAEMAWILLAICSFTCIALQGRSKLLSVSLSNYRRRNPRRIWKTNIELFVYTNDTLSKSITLA